jgi:type I restriction enzyme S subunit
VKSQADQRARGIAQKTLNLAEIRTFDVLVPPLALQKEFAARMNEIHVVQAQQATSRNRLGDLFDSVLHHTFSGGL